MKGAFFEVSRRLATPAFPVPLEGELPRAETPQGGRGLAQSGLVFPKGGVPGVGALTSAYPRGYAPRGLFPRRGDLAKRLDLANVYLALSDLLAYQALRVLPEVF